MRAANPSGSEPAKPSGEFLPRSRFHRERRAGLRRTDRDDAVLGAVFLNRAMRQDQIEARFFTSRQTAGLRLRLLFDHGYLRRDFPEEAPYGAPAVYTITGKAVPVVAARLGLDEDAVADLTRKSPTPAFLAHALGVVDFSIALERDAERTGEEIGDWVPEILCRHEYEIRPSGGGGWRREVFRPDGAFRIGAGAQARDGFLEYDLGHTSRRQFVDKVAGFVTFQRAGLYREIYGGGGAVLVVLTTGERRRAHLAALAARFPGADVRLGTRAEVAAEGPLSDVWRTPSGERVGLAAPARGPPTHGPSARGPPRL